MFVQALLQFCERHVTPKFQGHRLAAFGCQIELTCIAINRVPLIVFQPKEVLDGRGRKVIIDHVEYPETGIAAAHKFKVDIIKPRIGNWRQGGAGGDGSQ